MGELTDQFIDEILDDVNKGKIAMYSPKYPDCVWKEVAKKKRKQLDEGESHFRVKRHYRYGDTTKRFTEITAYWGERTKDIIPDPRDLYTPAFGLPQDESNVLVILLGGDTVFCTYHENYKIDDNDHAIKAFTRLYHPETFYTLDEVVFWGGVPSYIRTASEWARYEGSTFKREHF